MVGMSSLSLLIHELLNARESEFTMCSAGKTVIFKVDDNFVTVRAFPRAVEVGVSTNLTADKIGGRTYEVLASVSCG